MQLTIKAGRAKVATRRIETAEKVNMTARCKYKEQKDKRKAEAAAATLLPYEKETCEACQDH